MIGAYNLNVSMTQDECIASHSYISAHELVEILNALDAILATAPS